MEHIIFETYTRPNGHDEFTDWIQTLPIKDRAKLLQTITKVQNEGMLVAQRLKWVKRIDSNLYELRSKVGSNIQRALYFHVEHGQYVITHGFTKKTQKTPQREIEHALNLRKEWYTEHENQ